MSDPCDFIIRVYGIIINKHNEVLISDEFQLETKMTKFPGGGMEFGEGTIQCLEREIHEECNGQKIDNIKHFYTTDFFQKALYYKNHQLISIYYLASLIHPIAFKISDVPFDFSEMKNGNQSFRWKKIKELNVNEFTFPIDQLVAKKIKDEFK